MAKKFLIDSQKCDYQGFLSDMGCELDELKEHLEFMGLETTCANLIYFAFRNGLEEIQAAIDARLEDLESENELTEEEEEELKALYKLDVQWDFEITIDGNNSACTCIAHENEYYEYFKDAIEDFEYNTGHMPIKF